ncbi:hypothetical protein WJX81_005565, partial [Elliptochloris bilobata]
DLARGVNGVGYRIAARIDGVSPAYIKSSGVRALTRSATEPSAITGGETVEQLEVEMEQHRHTHNAPGMVSLTVLNSRPPVMKERLVAYQGKLVTVQDVSGAVANGTGFAITTTAVPDLDKTNLVVGRVVAGASLVDDLAAMPAVKANSSSPFFKVAKLAGDKRADVAEKSFGRPYSKIVVVESGMAN